MSFKYYISLAVGGALLMATSGCALLERSQKHVVHGSEGKVTAQRSSVTSETAETSNEPVLTPPKQGAVKQGKQPSARGKAVKNKKKKGKASEGSVSKSDLAEARREANEIGTSAVTVGGAGAGEAQNLKVHNELPDDFTIEGEWTIYSVRGNKVTGEERPYITFDLRAKRFYGSNGCNIINGNLTMQAKGELILDNIISTMRMCQDAPFEYLINLAVSDVKRYSARQEGPITFLDLKGADGRTLLVLRRHNMDFLNGAWRITDLNSTPVAGIEASMTINIPDLKIHGNTGCNIFNGELFIDPDKINSMQFMNLATTMKLCPQESRETEFLLGLESVETARKTGPDTIAMFDADCKEIFRMTRIVYNDDNER